MKADAAYLAIKERKRAEEFWKRVLKAEPVMHNKTFTFFDLGGFFLGLFDPASVGEEIRYGNNCVLNIRVDDADEEASRLGDFAKMVMPPRTVGHYRIFQIEDTEGNVIEFYSEGGGD